MIFRSNAIDIIRLKSVCVSGTEMSRDIAAKIGQPEKLLNITALAITDDEAGNTWRQLVLGFCAGQTGF